MIGGKKGLKNGQDDMDIGVSSDECCKHDPEKEGHAPKKCHWNEPNELEWP